MSTTNFLTLTNNNFKIKIYLLDTLKQNIKTDTESKYINKKIEKEKK